MSETGYQGWSNHATWLAALHINNDQGLQEAAQGIAREEWEAPDHCAGWSADDLNTLRLRDAGDRLKDWFESITLGDDGELQEAANKAGLYGLGVVDFLTHYIAEADWSEVAASLQAE